MKNNKISLFLSLVFVVFVGINIADAAIVALGQQKDVLGGKGPIGSRPDNIIGDKCKGYNFLKSDCKAPAVAINPCKFYPIYFEKCGCGADYKYSCNTNNEVGGSDSCNGKYSFCRCADKYVRNIDNICVLDNQCTISSYPITEDIYQNSPLEYNTSAWQCKPFCSDFEDKKRTSCECALPSCGDYNLGSAPANADSESLLCSNDNCSTRVTKYRIIGCKDGAELSGSNSCILCPSGKVSIGGSACQACPEGTYQDESGKSSCKPCPAGSSCSGGAEQPTTCADNSYAEANSGICKACEAPKTSSSGASSCSCPSSVTLGDGQACKTMCDGVCIEADGSACNAGYSTSTTSCDSGKNLELQSGNSSCKRCADCLAENCTIKSNGKCGETSRDRKYFGTCSGGGTPGGKCYEGGFGCGTGYICKDSECKNDTCSAGFSPQVCGGSTPIESSVVTIESGRICHQCRARNCAEENALCSGGSWNLDFYYANSALRCLMK